MPAKRTLRSSYCGEGTLHIVSEDYAVALRMLVPECNRICGIEIVRVPFALDEVRQGIVRARKGLSTFTDMF
jgi:hypothetical protein